MEEFTKSVEARLKDVNFVIDIAAKTEPEDCSLVLYENDEDWIAEFNAVVADESVPEAEGTYDIGTDTYVNMEITLPRNIDGSPMVGRVIKQASQER
jgi:hypothetical protein